MLPGHSQNWFQESSTGHPSFWGVPVDFPMSNLDMAPCIGLHVQLACVTEIVAQVIRESKIVQPFFLSW